MNIEHCRNCAALVAACILLAATGPAAASPPPAPLTVALLGKDFPLLGDWGVQKDSHHAVLFASPDGVHFPPAAAIVIPHAGRYRLWVAARDFPLDRPGTRTFSVMIGGKRAACLFGRSGKEGYSFEDGGFFDLPAGPVMVTLDQARPYARFQGLVLSNVPHFSPSKPLGTKAYAAARLYPLEGRLPQVPAAGLKLDAGGPQAVLSNERLRLEFLPAHRGELATLAIGVKVKTPQGWREVDIDPDAEAYLVAVAPAEKKLAFSGFYPTWPRADATPLTVEAGGTRVETISSRTTHSLLEAGRKTQFFPRSATAAGDAVRIEFHPSSAGKLSAVWRLLPGEPFAGLELVFIPAADGQASLAYEMFFRRELSRVAELLLPMMYQRKRLPEQDVTLLSNTTPTPLALVQPGGEPPLALALVADPRDIPYEWPDGRRAPYALSIRGPGATVQPALCAPVLGTPAAAARKGHVVRLRGKVLVEPGDWYTGFRTAVDQIFAVKDYRENVGASLSDAVLNMIDLYLDDDHGGWWPRAKAPYQIESKNGSTHAAPLLPLSLYRLTGDRRLLQQRAIPTLAFMLSRDGPHFSPLPEDPGEYPSGSLNGPVKLFGTATYAGLWELTGRRTPAFEEIAAPAGDPRPTAGYSHAAAFDEHLARYQLFHDPHDLARAGELADAYIQGAISTAPRKDLGPEPFFFISFVPDWEGLLWLYEQTGKQRYLDAAAFGARQLMTGLWSQPAIPPGKITVHAGGQFEDNPGHAWWRGPERFRLGYPRRPGDAPAHDLPAWTVSNVGLGFEQPITFRSSGAGRLIWQMGFSSHFLRLYRYTHDQAFLTAARNAVVGRWGNYPGYYVTGFTDLPQDPAYPRTGPDVTDFYYHHVAPHLTWCIDYLVSEAEMLSDGAVTFPALRQYGYAYFDSRVFGHAPGKVYDDPAAWLLFRRGVVAVDNRQVNTLLAWSEGKVHVLLANQSRQPQEVTLATGPNLRAEAGMRAFLRTGSARPQPLAFAAAGSVHLTVPGRSLATVTFLGVKVDPPARPQFAAGRKAAAPLVLPGGPAEARAAAIQVDSGPWYAYVWSTALPRQARSARLRYRVAGERQMEERAEYPFEFLVPVADDREPFRFQLELTLPDGTIRTSPEATLDLR